MPSQSGVICANPFCDGYGNLDVSVKGNGAAWRINACEVGPHDEPNPMVASATSDEQSAKEADDGNR